jgi:hypothetical protein
MGRPLTSKQQQQQHQQQLDGIKQLRSLPPKMLNPKNEYDADDALLFPSHHHHPSTFHHDDPLLVLLSLFSHLHLRFRY